MKNPIFTLSGRLGDTILALPIFSWYYKTHGGKAIVVLANFAYVEGMIDLLNIQECVEKAILSTYTPRYYRIGGQPYHWNPFKYGLNIEEAPYYNLGYKSKTDKYAPEFFAEEYGFGVDYDFTLNYGPVDNTYKEQIVKVDRWKTPWLDKVNAVALTDKNSMIKNLQYAAGAKEVLTVPTGFSILMALARLPMTFYQTKRRGEDWYMTRCFKISGPIKRIFVDGEYPTHE